MRCYWQNYPQPQLSFLQLWRTMQLYFKGVCLNPLIIKPMPSRKCPRHVESSLWRG